jgi:hypothetical protein
LTWVGKLIELDGRKTVLRASPTAFVNPFSIRKKRKDPQNAVPTDS